MKRSWGGPYYYHVTIPEHTLLAALCVSHIGTEMLPLSAQQIVTLLGEDLLEEIWCVFYLLHL